MDGLEKALLTFLWTLIGTCVVLLVEPGLLELVL